MWTVFEQRRNYYEYPEVPPWMTFLIEAPRREAIAVFYNRFCLVPMLYVYEMREYDTPLEELLSGLGGDRVRIIPASEIQPEDRVYT